MTRPPARWLDRPPAGWDALLAADPTAGATQRPELLDALAAALPGGSVRVAVVEDGGRLVGGAAALLERRGGFEWLHVLPRLLPGAPLALPGEHARVDEAVARALEALARERRVVGGEWSLYRADGPPVDEGAIERVGGETRWLEAAIVELDSGVDGALRRMDRKHRQALQRTREPGLAFAEAPDALDEAYALHAAQARAWSGHAALPIELSRRLLVAGDPPVARLFALRDGGGLLAAALALDGPRETFVWWSGTHADARRRLGFTRLLWGIVEWAAEHGRARVNLGASTGLESVASFKQSLGAAGLRYAVRWLDARHAPPLARALAALQARWRRGRARGAPA